MTHALREQGANMRVAAVLTLFFMATNSFARALNLEELKGWRVVEVKKDRLLESIFGDSDYLLVVTDPNDPEKPTVQVRSRGVVGSFAQSRIQNWPDLIFVDKNRPQTIKSQSLTKRDGGYRYFAEFETDLGTPDRLRSLLMATLIDGELRLFVFEQAQPEYQRSMERVREMLLALKVRKADGPKTRSGRE